MNGDPYYKSASDLHALGLPSNNSGTAIAGLTLDIDGQLRASTPDIGADEFTASPNDAGLDSLSDGLFCFGSNAIYTTLTNYGTQALTSVSINWSVAKNYGLPVSQPVVNWTGNLATGQSAIVNLGSFSFSNDTTYQFLANTSSPNNNTDGFSGNDSVNNSASKTAMSGTYIVAQQGGGDYSTLIAAVSDLTLRGVCAPTTIKVQTGTYANAVSIPKIEGASATSPVVIESDSTNLIPAVLSSTGFTVQFNSAEYITLRGFTINSLSKAPVYLTGGNRNLVIEGNNIENNTSVYRGHYSQNAGVSISNTTNQSNINISLIGNTIKGGYYGLYYNNSVKSNGGIFKGNVITEFTSVGVVIQNDNDVLFEKNSVIDSSYTQADRGVEVSYSNIDFISNKVVVTSSYYGRGVHITYSQDTSSTNRRIVNNAITVVRTSNNVNSAGSWGLSMYNCFAHDIYHNSVSMEGGLNSVSRAFSSLSSTNANLKNNSFSNLTGGYAMYFSHSQGIATSDYNNIYTTGTNLVYGISGNHTTLTGWRNATVFGNNSTSANPNYMTAFEMRPNHIALDGTAGSLPSVMNDIDGVSRGSNPDIGAYQFNTRKDDAGSAALVSKQLCNGTQSVVFALKNFGGDTLKSVQVAWLVSNNGGPYVSQPAYSWNGILPPGDVDSNVVVGTYSFSGGNYQVESYTSSPNGKVDELFSNDTINEQLFVQFNGTYTVGGLNPDFVNWKSFANSINDAGVCGPVIIKARPGVYNESIILKDISGLTSTNNMVITRDTGLGSVVISDTNTAVTLENLKYVTIKNIEFKNTGSLSALRLDGANSYITIDSNTVVGPYSTSASSDESAIYVRASGVNVNDHLVFSNNKISNGSMGLYIAGSSNIKSNEKIQVFKNTISEFDAYGLYIYSADSIGLDSNVITSSVIQGKTNTTGIYFHWVEDFMVSRNSISIEGETSTASGITMYRSHGTTLKSNHLVNNFVHVLEGNGIYINKTNYLNVYYNSVNISKAKYVAGYACRLSSSFGNNLLNNSFANLAGGFVFYDYSGFSSNYNNLYTTGQLITRNNIQTMANWRTLSGQDANSVSADPIYLSTIDLHANQTLLDSSATALGTFNMDIDGEVRDASFPDMGADEYTLIENVGIVEVLNPTNKRARKWTSTAFSGLDTVEVVVRNFGPPAQDIPIEMQFLGMVQQDTLWGTLNAGARDTFRFPLPLNLDTIGTHNIRVFTAMQNDQYIEDDTLDLKVVTLENSAVKLPFVEGFEGIKDTSLFESHLGLWDAEEWDFASNGGRLQTKSGKKAGGSQAITLDRTPNGSTIINELVLNLNMTRYDVNDSVFLSFDYIDHRDERHAGDSVWVRGSDTSAWVGVFDLWRNRRTNRVKEILDLDITSALAQVGQNYSSSFQVRFGQEDNQKLPGDGRTFDNIVLRAVHPYDLEVSNAMVEYSQVPVEMANNRFHSTITNNGYLTADSVTLNVDVAGFMNKLLVGSLVSEGDTNVSITDSLGGLTVGVQTAFIYADFNRVDKCFENDSMDFNFSLTDTVLARDNNVVDTTFGFTGGAGEMGTVLEVFNQDTITSVSFYLNFPTVGDTLRAAVYQFNNGSVGNSIATTEYWVVNSNASRWYNLPIKCLEALEPGKYLIAVEQTSTNYLTIGLTKDNYMSAASFINTGSQWTAFEDSLSGYLFNIHANFGKYDLPSINTPAGLCLNDNPIVLKSNFSGGVFAGPGVVNDTIFNPKLAGAGTHFLTYSLLKPNGCYDSNGVHVIVDSIPVVSLASQADICENEGLLNLSGGLPAGGVYFGTGVSGTRFDPTTTGAGSQTIMYRYAKPISGCSDTASVTVRVKQVPSVSLGTINDFCLNDSSKTLSHGLPIGGKYQGVGIINDSIFNPVTSGLGSFRIVYEFVDTNMCSDTASQLVTVNDTPKVDLGSDTVLCFGTSLGLSGQSIGSYKWSTGAITEHIWVTVNGTYWLETTSLKGCMNSDTINVSYDGNCVGVNELNDLANLEFYPNPTTGLVNLKINGIGEGNVQLVVRNIYGQELSTYSWTIDQSNAIQTIDLSKEAVGVYFLETTTPSGKSIQKVNVGR
ncbi:MAG: T9SS type A sorting domain-containing protein [Salibacteraceae bacterium]